MCAAIPYKTTPLVCCCRRRFHLENQGDETAQHVKALATQPWPRKFASQNPHKRQMWQLTRVLPVRALLQQRGERRSEQKGDLASKTRKQGAVWGGNLLPKCCFLTSRNRSLTFSFLFFWTSVWSACLWCTTCTPVQTLDEDVSSLGPGVTDDYKPPSGRWELSLGPRKRAK